RLGGGRRRPRRAGPGRLRLLLFDSLLLALHASPPRGEPGCGARVGGLRQGLSRCWGMGLPGVRIVPSDGIRPPGGTGPQQAHLVAGPRVRRRAAAAAGTVRTAGPGASVRGYENAEAVARSTRLVLTFPFGGLASFLAAGRAALAGKLVIDVIVPLAVRNGFFELTPVEGAASAGELIQQTVPAARDVSAFKNHSAETLQVLAAQVPGRVVLFGNDAGAR